MKASFCLNVLFCLIAHVGYVLSFDLRHIGLVAKNLGMLRPWMACPLSYKPLHEFYKHGVDGRTVLTFMENLALLTDTGKRRLLERVDLIVCMKDYAESDIDNATTALTSLLESSARNAVDSTWLFGKLQTEL